MLNLSQRLYIGCLLQALLTVGLVLATHSELTATGKLGVAVGFYLP